MKYWQNTSAFQFRVKSSPGVSSAQVVDGLCQSDLVEFTNMLYMLATTELLLICSQESVLDVLHLKRLHQQILKLEEYDNLTKISPYNYVYMIHNHEI